MRDPALSNPARETPRVSQTRARALAIAIGALVLLGASPAERAPAEGGAPRSPADGTARQDRETSNDLLARALATALQTVRDHYARSAVAIPADVRERLEDEYGDELARARYAVSPEAVGLLATIDRFEGTSFGKGMHALTIDGLILLATHPAEKASPVALWIWAHELHHVRQYRERGSILGFARDYLRDCDAIERAADERANRALGMKVSVDHCLR